MTSMADLISRGIWRAARIFRRALLRRAAFSLLMVAANKRGPGLAANRDDQGRHWHQVEIRLRFLLPVASLANGDQRLP